MTAAAGTVLLFVASGAVIVITVVLVRMATQLMRTATEVERLTRSVNDDLLPRVERVLEQTASELIELCATTEAARRIAQNATKTVETVGEFTTATRHAVTPILHAVEEVGGLFRQVTALALGFKTTLGALGLSGGEQSGRRGRR